ncbi:hypothetical protein SAY86_029458 [Trapa natans]|uniref:Uncharacterized protein n=1 Tax=Trapa natans TaxID=22666 RepID=A0AAN7RBY1_TRANT|nr:hypothetical protein SAY86_029458 [Trapa natans]
MVKMFGGSDAADPSGPIKYGPKPVQIGPSKTFISLDIDFVLTKRVAFKTGDYKQQVIFIGGLTDGFLATESGQTYLEPLAIPLEKENWSLVQVLLSHLHILDMGYPACSKLCRAMGGAEIEHGSHALSNRVHEAVQAIFSNRSFHSRIQYMIQPAVESDNGGLQLKETDQTVEFSIVTSVYVTADVSLKETTRKGYLGLGGLKHGTGWPSPGDIHSGCIAGIAYVPLTILAVLSIIYVLFGLKIQDPRLFCSSGMFLSFPFDLSNYLSWATPVAVGQFSVDFHAINPSPAQGTEMRGTALKDLFDVTRGFCDSLLAGCLSYWIFLVFGPGGTAADKCQVLLAAAIDHLHQPLIIRMVGDPQIKVNIYSDELKSTVKRHWQHRLGFTNPHKVVNC